MRTYVYIYSVHVWWLLSRIRTLTQTGRALLQALRAAAAAAASVCGAVDWAYKHTLLRMRELRDATRHTPGYYTLGLEFH